MKIFWCTVFILLCYSTFGQKATDFSFKTIEGKDTALSTYEGEVVYISFWATWCKPCLQNFEKYNDTRTKLEDMGIVLLNVSIDKNKKAWESYLSDAPFLNGVNVHVSDVDAIQDIYNLYSIPAYEILNKNGEFVYLSTEGGRDIFSEFKGWLEE